MFIDVNSKICLFYVLENVTIEFCKIFVESKCNQLKLIGSDKIVQKVAG